MRRCTERSRSIDAALLAEIAELLDFKQEFKVWQAPSANVLEIRACSRRLSELSQQKARANPSTLVLSLSKQAQGKQPASRLKRHTTNAHRGDKQRQRGYCAFRKTNR